MEEGGVFDKTNHCSVCRCCVGGFDFRPNPEGREKRQHLAVAYTQIIPLIGER